VIRHVRGNLRSRLVGEIEGSLRVYLFGALAIVHRAVKKSSRIRSYKHKLTMLVRSQGVMLSTLIIVICVVATIRYLRIAIFLGSKFIDFF